MTLFKKSKGGKPIIRRIRNRRTISTIAYTIQKTIYVDVTGAPNLNAIYVKGKDKPPIVDIYNTYILIFPDAIQAV